MSSLPPCPQCQSAYTYEDGGLYVCPECAHEWSADAGAKDLEELVVVIEVWMNEDGTVRDAHISSDTRIRNAAHRAAADRALRAVLNERCQPFKLPPEKYARWRQMKLEFYPSDD